MNDKKTLEKASKFMSYALRHDPKAVGLVLDEGGWADVSALVIASNGHHPLTEELLYEVVAACEKQRYALSDDKKRIRARQGHSIKVDLNLTPIQPPDFLYHGTATRFLDMILDKGLLKMERQHVHLSKDSDTAYKVGSRHGSPIILTIDAKKMHQDGFQFFLSENNVWLTDHVPVLYIKGK